MDGWEIVLTVFAVLIGSAFIFSVCTVCYIKFCIPNVTESDVEEELIKWSKLTEPLDKLIEEHAYFIKHGKFPEVPKLAEKKYGVLNLSERPNYEAKMIRDTVSACRGGARHHYDGMLGNVVIYEDPNTMTTVFKVKNRDGYVTEKRVSKECMENDDDWRDS